MNLLNMKIKNFIFLLFFVLLIVSSIFSGLIGFQYIDEIICILALISVLFNFMSKKEKISIRYFAFVGAVFIGFLGNFIYRINNLGVLDILIDTFLFFKPYIMVIFAYVYFNGLNIKDKEEVLSYVIKLSKFFIVVLFIGALLSSFYAPLNDSGGYAFYSGYRGEIAMITFALLSAIYLMDSKNNFLYYIFSLIIIIFTDAGLGILGIILFFILNIVLKKMKINFLLVILIGVVSILIGYKEIVSYLLNMNAPRAKMLYSSILNAIRFFPLGSGFGTFGGYIAAKKYSVLYYDYGISNMYLMGPSDVNGPNFLFDFYYPQIFGQLGIFGSLLMIYIAAYYLKKSIQSKNHLLLSMILYILAMGLGFNIGGVAGCILFLIMGLVYSKNQFQINYATDIKINVQYNKEM